MTNKETPFKIKVPKEKQLQMARDLENVENLKSAIHFIKNYKDCIIVNKKFKKKAINFSIKTVAGLSSLAIAMTLINNINKVEPTNDITPEETKIEEVKIEPVIKEETINDINTNNNDININSEDVNNTIDNDIINSDEINNTIDDDIILETEEINNENIINPSITISYPKASNTNERSDYNNYYKVKSKYGLYIDKLSEESGIDSRIIIAMIAQENPNDIDSTNVGTYGPMCVTSVHNGEICNYGYYNNSGEFDTKKVHININNLKSNHENNQLYKNGEYGKITNAEAMCIYYGTVIIKDNYKQINKFNKGLSPVEKFILSISAYNHGYPDVIRCTKNSKTLFDACYSIRYKHAGDVKYDDDQYIEHVLNKIPEEELSSPFLFTDNKGNQYSFNLEKNNDIAAITSTENTKKIAL